MTPKLLRRLLKAGGVCLLLALPWIPGVKLSIVDDANLAGEYTLIAVSLVILTGWVGQISLGHAAFVGIGAFTTGLLARELHVPFPINLPIAAAITAAVASLLGLVALRVRGLYLAVATLIFAWMADAYLFTSAWFVGEGGSSSIENVAVGRPGTITFFDFADPRVFYIAMLATVAAVMYIAVNLKESKTGRAFFAIRGSEVAAVSLGINVTRYKLLAFATSGALAGIAGNLRMIDLGTASPVSFQFTFSLLFLSIAVVGGITSLGGAVAASILFAGLNELFFRVAFLQGWLDIVAVGLLLTVLLLYPGGLGALGASIKLRFRRSAEGRESETRVESERAWLTADVRHHPLPPDREDRVRVLDARDITVVFGGLVATDKVSIQVNEHEIVGLIGPNGAGKTTTFNAIAGLNEPAGGRIELFGKDATSLAVHERARLGVGRTFQLIQLFPQLTVFENLLVATHVHNPTGMLRHVLLSDRAVAAEAAARARVQDIVALMGLHDIVDRRIAGLPFGLLRQVEIARALVTQAPFLMLDEPASGLDNNETEILSQLIRFIRSELGVSILLIEHDVKMVTSVCDYIYVIDQGKPLADGRPEDIQRNPAVIAAYLGTVAEEPAVA